MPRRPPGAPQAGPYEVAEGYGSPWTWRARLAVAWFVARLLVLVAAPWVLAWALWVAVGSPSPIAWLRGAR